MGDIVEEFAKEYAQEYGEIVRVEERSNMIKHLMQSLKCSLDDALNMLNIQGNDRETIIKRINC